VTNEPAASPPSSRSGSGTAILIGFVVLLAFGVGYWFYRSMVRDRSTAEVSLVEYLDLKSQGHLRVVRLEGADLDAEIADGSFVRDGRGYPRIHTVVPPAYLVDPKGFAELHSGLSPSQFIHTKR